MAFEILSTSAQKSRTKGLAFSIAIIGKTAFDVTVSTVKTPGLQFNFPEGTIDFVLFFGLMLTAIPFFVSTFHDYNSTTDTIPERKAKEWLAHEYQQAHGNILASVRNMIVYGLYGNSMIRVSQNLKYTPGKNNNFEKISTKLEQDLIPDKMEQPEADENFLYKIGQRGAHLGDPNKRILSAKYITDHVGQNGLNALSKMEGISDLNLAVRVLKDKSSSFREPVQELLDVSTKNEENRNFIEAQITTHLIGTYIKYADNVHFYRFSSQIYRSISRKHKIMKTARWIFEAIVPMAIIVVAFVIGLQDMFELITKAAEARAQ
jgi:hypothetical protein